MRVVEGILLLLVVAHAAIHLPHDLHSILSRLPSEYKRRIHDGRSGGISRSLALLVIALACVVAVSPVLYYSLELIGRLVVREA